MNLSDCARYASLAERSRRRIAKAGVTMNGDRIQTLNEDETDDAAVMGPLSDRISELQAVLEEWKEPAMTKDSSMDALRLASKELQMFSVDGPAPALVAAALSSFETQI